MNMKNLAAWVGALTALGSTTQTFAQTKFPDGPLRIIVPFAPGGGVDSAARMLAKQLSTDLRITVVVENRAGASGTIGGKAVQTAAPDGMTLLFSATTHIHAKAVLATAPYDPQTDFVPVARMGEAPLLLVITPNLAPTKLSEVVSAAKAQPDQWTAALPALGAPAHLATLMFAKTANLKLTTATYKGTAPALTDVAGGHAQILLDSIVSIAPMARGGKVKPIAVTASKRSAVMPDVPTAAESGLPGLVYASWYGLWAPKGTPDDRVQALNKAVNHATSELSKAGLLNTVGIEPVFETSDQFRKYIATEIAEGADLLKNAGYKPE
jgi:tripartite-type tricarboxylate transporter receptor subunit TctC